MTVRPLREGDIDTWRAMRRALWPDCRDEIHRAEMGALRRGDPHGAVFVSVDDAGVVNGFIEVSARAEAEGCHSGRVGYIEGWYVVSARRGIGIGRALVAAAEAWARGQSCREMASDTEVENLASQRAHRHLGFEDIGRLVHFRKELG